MIQAGYYTLKTLEGIANGYVCLTYMGNQLEVRIRVDKSQGNQREYKGYFTKPFATAPEEPCAIILTSGAKDTPCLGTGTIGTQNLPTIENGVDFTLFSQGRPCMAAQIVMPEAKPEPELTPTPESKPEPEPAPETAPEAKPELASAPEVTPAPEPETETESEPAPQTCKLQEFDPFNTTNDAYHWWICTGTESFYQLMEDTGIVPDPPLYTALSQALTRFSHFLFGRYEETDQVDRRILYIFGVPVSGSTPVPSQINARWIPAQNKIAGTSNYAGYWLYYFDAESKRNVRAKLRE